MGRPKGTRRRSPFFASKGMQRVAPWVLIVLANLLLVSHVHFLQEDSTSTSSLPLETASIQDQQLVVDVLSIASNTRLEYVEAQRRTWASHSMVRNFFHVTEDDDPEPNCYKELKNEDVFAISQSCRNKGINGPDSTWIQRRMAHLYARVQWLKKKKSPVGWMCAQKRFPAGLAKVLRSYKERSQDLPAYLLLVDGEYLLSFYCNVFSLDLVSDPTRR